jgi:predicted peroxiredoxin
MKTTIGKSSHFGLGISFFVFFLMITSCRNNLQDGVFVHITEGYNDPHRVLMPLKMANNMADNKAVLVYMDIHSVNLLARGADDLNMPGFEPAQSYIKSLIAKNVKICACPTCLTVAGISPEELIDGVQVADKEDFFSFASGRIITLDY